MWTDKSVQASRALGEMAAQARAAGVQGVAVVAWLADGGSLRWESRMQVVDKTVIELPNGKGHNLIAIAWSKTAEMMATHQDSGRKDRTLYTGELGFPGGAIRPLGQGFVLAAFSGGTSEQDYILSESGIRAFSQND